MQRVGYRAEPSRRLQEGALSVVAKSCLLRADEGGHEMASLRNVVITVETLLITDGQAQRTVGGQGISED